MYKRVVHSNFSVFPEEHRRLREIVRLPCQAQAQNMISPLEQLDAVVFKLTRILVRLFSLARSVL